MYNREYLVLDVEAGWVNNLASSLYIKMSRVVGVALLPLRKDASSAKLL